MKRRLIYLSSLTLTVVVNLSLASAQGRGGRWRGEKGELRKDTERSVKREDGLNEGRPRWGERVSEISNL